MAMLAEPEMNHLDMDEFINFSVTNESPARPIIMRMNAAAAAAAAAAGNNGNGNSKQEPSSPFGGDFNINDLTGHNNNDWLNAMGGIESVMSVSTPSSRGSSLETPGLPQNGFVSIDPTRLKEVPSAPGSEMSKSPAWSLPDLQPSSYEQPSSFTTSTEPVDMPPADNALALVPASTTTTTQKPAESTDGTMIIGKRKRRQSCLPEIVIPVMTQTPQARGLQRSMSTGTPIIVTQLDMSSFNQGNFLGFHSPVDGPMSAPAGDQSPMPFSTYPAAPNTGVPLLAPQPTPVGGGHQRSYSHSGLATIPEAPSSAPPDVQWTPIPSCPPQVRYGNTDITTYTVPPPPATPSLPSNSAAPSPLITQEPFNSNSALTITEPLRRPSSCPGTSASTNGPSRLGYTLQLQQQEAQRQYLLPHVQQFQMQQTQNGLSPQMADPMSAHAHFSPLPNYSPQLPEGQFPAQPGHMSNGPMSAGPMSAGPMSAGPFTSVPLSAGPMSAGPMSATVVGMGRPVLHPHQTHTRRSSDSELAFAMGQPNVGAMLRSTSVPQAIIEPTPIYANSLPPPPSVSNYAPMTFVPYEPHGLGYGRPRGDSEPPRKRVASKRVGTCLKPGPKGKPKPKTEGEMTLTLSQPLGSMGSLKSFDDEVLHSIHGDIPTDLAPVSFEEFQASFTITPAGTIIPMLGIEAMTERLMYATAEPVVDACFRWCYQIGSEFNHAAEKQSKFFRCCFDECVGTNSRIFMRKSAVDSHVRTHIGFRPFRCEADPECDARFVRKHDRDRHVATTHRNEKSFLCTDCGQNFARSDALLRHRAKRDACKARTGQL